MKFNPDIHRRRSIRLKDYDYSKAGAYFMTVCAWNRECLFGEIVDGTMRVNEYGRVVAGDSHHLVMQLLHDATFAKGDVDKRTPVTKTQVFLLERYYFQRMLDGKYQLGQRYGFFNEVVGSDPGGLHLVDAGYDLVLLRLVLALDVHRLSRKADAGSGFEGDAHQDVLPGRNAAEDAPGVIREKPLRRDFIAMFRALVFDAAKAGADLNAFDRVDAHHRARDVGIEPVEDRFAQAHGHSGGNQVDPRAVRG